MSERANQPTEEPTLRRWQKALEDGQVAFSTEAVGALIVLTAVLLLRNLGPTWAEGFLNMLKRRLTFFEPMIESPETIMLAISDEGIRIGLLVSTMMFSISAVVIAAGLLQTRFNLSWKPIGLNWQKLSPIAGVKRIFSTRTLNRLGLSILKTVAIVASAIWTTMSYQLELANSASTSLPAVLQLGSTILQHIGIVVAVLLIVVGVVDLAFQLWKQHQDLMMTKEEVRQEQKDSDGDPQIKARIRRIQSEMSKQRMTQDVPQATVVITNPTHFAVALRYDPELGSAPIVVAKGADHLAKQIIKIAKANEVAVVERKPVARFLYANVEVGHEIPFELYHAVAEIMNFIRDLDRAARR